MEVAMCGGKCYARKHTFKMDKTNVLKAGFKSDPDPTPADIDAFLKTVAKIKKQFKDVEPKCLPEEGDAATDCICKLQPARPISAKYKINRFTEPDPNNNNIPPDFVVMTYPNPGNISRPQLQARLSNEFEVDIACADGDCILRPDG